MSLTRTFKWNLIWKTNSLQSMQLLHTIREILRKAWNDLKRPTTRRTRPKTTWNDLRRHTTSKKLPQANWQRPETTYNKQKMSWNDLQRTDSNFIEPLYLKNRRATISQRSNRCILCVQYFISSVYVQNDSWQESQNKRQNKTKWHEKN